MEIDKKWEKEVSKRLYELRSGEVEAILGDEVFDKLNKRFSE